MEIYEECPDYGTDKFLKIVSWYFLILKIDLCYLSELRYFTYICKIPKDRRCTLCLGI